MKKRLLSMILALSMMLTILPVNAITALAANDSCGANLTYKLTQNTDDPDTYTLTIGGEGAMYDYSSSYTTVPWNAQKSRITSVVIDDGVTSIGDSAFEDCSALKSVSGMKGVTSLGEWAFCKCTSLESFTIPSGVKSIPDSLFYDCSKLNSVTIHNQVASIGSSAFFGCSILKTLSIPDSVQTIGYYAFGGCNELETINIPDGVTKIPAHAFSSCYALKKLDIPQSVTEIGSAAFDHCTSLGKDSHGTIAIPANVTAIGSEAFRGCSALTSLALPQTVTSIGDTAFQGCSNLETINIPSGVKAIEHDTFRGCEKLKDVTIPAYVTSIGNSAFEACKTFKNIKIPEGVTTIGKNAFEDCTQLETVVIPSTAINIYDSAFKNCQQLKSFAFPIGTTQIDSSVLSGCENLESVTIPEGVTKIWGSAFYGCSKKLKSVQLPSTLQTIGFQAFCDCDQLSEITIPKSVTSIGQSAFGSCTKLESVMLAKNSVPTIAEGAFSKTLGTKIKIYYPDYKAGWFAQNAAEKITDLKTDGVTINSGGISMDVDICYLCDVTFDANGGTLASGAPAKTQVYRTEMVTNTKASNLKTVDDPSKSECSFIGWYTSPTPQEGEAAFRLVNTPVDPQTEDGNLTLYAVYTTAPEHATVTISGLENNATLIKGNEQQFTVTIDPKDDTGNGALTFEFTNHETLYHQKADGSWEEVTGNTLNVGLADGPQNFKFTPSTTGPNKLTVGVKADSNTTGIANTADVSFTVRDSIPATVTISGPTDNTVKAGEGSDVFTVAANKGDTDAAKAEFDFAGGKVQYRTGDTGEWLDLTSNELNIDDLTGKQFRVVPDADAVTGQKTLTVKLMDASGNEIAGASDSKTFDVTARVHATVEINELNGKTIKQNKPYTFTVTVTAHDDSGNAILTFDNVAGLTYNGTAVTDAGVTVTLTNQPAPLTFTLTPDAEGAGKTLTATLNNGAMDTATYTVSEYEHAKVTIDGLDTDLKQGESKNFTVTVDPKDDRGDATIDFGNKNSEIQYKDGEDWKSMPSDGLKIDLNNGKKPYDFRITPKNDGENQKLTATVKKENTKLGEAEKSYNVSKYVDAVVKIDGLSGTVETDTEKEFTVTVTANDDAGKNVTAKAGFTGPAGATVTLKKVQYRFGDSGEWQDGMQELNGMNLDINSLELPFNSLPNITYKLTVTFAEAGNYKFDVSLTKKDAAEAFTSDSAEVTVTKKKEPVTPGSGENPGENPGGGSTGGGENPGENPGGNPGSGSTTPKRKLEIADGTLTRVTVKDENGNLKDITDTITKDLDGKYEIPVGAKVTITAKDAPEGMKFGEWSISDKTLLSDPDVPYTEKDLIFTMPDNPDGVKLSVVYLEESIGEEPNLVEKGALAGTVVVGSAALLYQGHMLGTELYLRYLLPHGAIIPQNRAELAVLLWQDAENPEPVSTTLYSDISDEDSAIQQAARWAVENDLMEQLDAEEHPDHFDPFVPVTFSDSIRAWKKAQELKKSVH